MTYSAALPRVSTADLITCLGREAMRLKLATSSLTRHHARTRNLALWFAVRALARDGALSVKADSRLSLMMFADAVIDDALSGQDHATRKQAALNRSACAMLSRPSGARA
jgi:hypothetical protein